MNADEERALDNIHRFGYHVVFVPGDFTQTSFSYSIGIEKTFGHPEIVVTGLAAEVARLIIARYVARLNSGDVFVTEERYADLLEGSDVIFKPVDPINYPGYFGWALWLYKHDSFRMVQAVYPSSSGTWPWDPHPPAGYLWDLPTFYTD